MPGPKREKAEPASPVAEAKADEADVKPSGEAADGAIAEVENEPIKLMFRGQEFAIDRKLRGSGRYAIALAAGQHHVAIVELLEQKDVGRFIALLKRGEDFSSIATEFFDDLAKASGSGNS